MANWQARLKALNEAMGGVEPEQIAEGLNPLELVGAFGSGVDSVTGAPVRAAIGSAITGGDLEDLQQAYERQFGANPELAPSFGLVEDALLDPTNLLAASPKMAARLAALGDVGAVGKDVSQLPKSPGFYSKLIETIKEKMGTRATPEQVRGMLRDVKPEEYEWLGVEDYLQGLQGTPDAAIKVGKEDFLKHVEKNVPNIQKEMYGEIKDFADPEKREAAKRIIEKHGVLGFDSTAQALNAIRQEGIGPWSDGISEKEISVINDYLKDIPKNPPKYGQHTLPGGTNYRELLFKMPTPDWHYPGRRDAPSSEAAEQIFKSGHWKEPNVLAHARVKDRVTQDGKKVLFAEEIQSDWHQAGREKGYVAKNFKAAEKAFKEYSKKLAEKYDLNPEQNLAMWSTIKKMEPDEVAKYEQLQSAWLKGGANGWVPDAPLKKTWHEYVLKNLVKDAIEGGYDKVAWTTGKQQAERYNLEKYVTEIGYNTKTKNLVAFVKGADEAVHHTVEPGELANYIGKETAEKLLKAPTYKSGAGNDVHYLQGLDLKIGGEGMKGFYDKILVDYAKKFGKKYGANVGKIKLDVPETSISYEEFQRRKAGGDSDIGQFVNFLEITPKMREEILKKGLPLFSVPAAMRLKALEDGSNQE